MRTIKFRGKSIATGKWVYGGFVHVVKENLDLCAIVLDDLSIVSVKHGTVGLYTGLQDSNGNEVYEGDIIKREYPFEGKYVVRWNERFKCIHYNLVKDESSYLIPSDFDNMTYIVVGNEVDNPELLKPQDNGF